MGNCTPTQKNSKIIEKAKKAIENEGFEVVEIWDGKIEKRISNKVVIAKKQDKKYAIKVRHYENQLDQQGISAQVGVLKELVHKNIVKVISHFTKQHMFFFQLDYYPITLWQLLHKNQLSRELQFKFATELIQAISFIHSQGHTHRELKAQNVMIKYSHNLNNPEQQECQENIIENSNDEQSLLVCEFGLELDSDMAAKRLETQAQSDKWYLAPEIKQSNESIYYQQNNQTDVWAVGLILAEIFGWEYTSNASSPQKLEILQEMIFNEEKQEQCLKVIEKDVRSKILQMLHLNPDKRGDISDYLSYFKNQFKQLYSNPVNSIKQSNFSLTALKTNVTSELTSIIRQDEPVSSSITNNILISMTKSK